MPLSRTHPSWCEYPYAPADSTHTHTALIGATKLDGPATVELVMIQQVDSAAPSLSPTELRMSVRAIS
jgi:hypothetical protein